MPISRQRITNSGEPDLPAIKRKFRHRISFHSTGKNDKEITLRWNLAFMYLQPIHKQKEEPFNQTR
jgi:hypothetical protein